MHNKTSSQQGDIWTVITNRLVEAVKMTFSIFAFIFTAGSKKSPDKCETAKQDGWRDGHSGYGFYSGDIKNDDE